ncbi:glutamate receptor 3.2-like protein [Tanacetum coccineum]
MPLPSSQGVNTQQLSSKLESFDTLLSVVDDSGKREQKREIGNDIGDEGIESNNVNGVVDITIGLMHIGLMGCDDGANVSFSMNGNSDCVVIDVDFVEECLSGMQMEADKPLVIKFEKKSVEKNGNEGEAIEFIVGDIIREEGFEEDRKNGNNDPSVVSDCLATLKSEEILVKSDWKKCMSAVQLCTFPRNTYEMDQFDEAVHEFSLVNVCWLLRSTQASVRKYAKGSGVSSLTEKSSIQKHKEVMDNISGCSNVIKCLGRETITKKNQMVFKQLFEFASGVNLANDIKESNGKRVREIDAYFGDLGLEKRIKQILTDKPLWLGNVEVHDVPNDEVQPEVQGCSEMSFLLFLPLIFGALSVVYPESDIVNIGSVVAMQTIHGKVSTIAMKAAVDDVNSDPAILPGRQLKLSILNANFSGFVSIVGALKYMQTDTVAIIGPQSSVMAHVLSHIANDLHVPLLSFTASDPTLSPLQFPYFLQTAPNDLYQMKAVAAIISYFHYREVTAVYTDDDQFRNSISLLGYELAKKNCRLSGKVPLPGYLRATREIIRDELLKVMSMESRVILLHTYFDTGLIILEIANSLNMMRKGYVWIATTWLSTVVDSIGIPHNNKLHGVLTLRPHTPYSYKKRAFSRRWKNLSKGSIGLNPYALYAYDTVWIIANAVDKLLKEGGNISFSNASIINNMMGTTRLNLKSLSIFDGGKRLLTNMLQTNMTGLTGPILFNRDRALRNPSFDVINIIQTQGRLVGYWSNYSGISVQIPKSSFNVTKSNTFSSNQQLGSVVWPGNAKEKPRGWEFTNNGRPLRIGVPLRAGFKEMVMQINGTKQVAGFSIDVFLSAIKLLPYPLPYEFIKFGNGHNNPSYSDLVNKVASNVFDAAVGDITIVSNRTKAVDFTQPYIESGLVVVVNIHKAHPSSWAYLQPFSPSLWGVTALFFIFVGTLVWLLEHRHNDEFRGPLRKQIVTVMWFTFSTMFFAHRENTVSTLGRMVVFIWLFVVLIVNSSYTASLTSILTVQQLQTPITGIESLITGNELIGFPVGTYIETYLVNELNIPRSRLVSLGTSEEYAENLLSRTVAAIVDERPYVDLFLSKHCSFQVVGQELTNSGLGFAFPRDSPLAVDLSNAILNLTETGELQKIQDHWLNKKACGPQSLSFVSNQLQTRGAGEQIEEEEDDV